jgi:hypothetical protein
VRDLGKKFSAFILRAAGKIQAARTPAAGRRQGFWIIRQDRFDRG